MPFKVILNVDPETGESDNFLWNEKEDPPPLVRGKIKIKTNISYIENSEEGFTTPSKSNNKR